MTELLIKLMNAPLWVRRLIAGALSLMILGVVFSVIFLPLNLLSQKAANLQDKREQLGRFERVITASNGLPDDDRSDSASQLFLSGDNQAVMQAELQTRLNALARKNNVTVFSVGPGKIFEANGVRYIGIRANLGGSVAGIHNMLFTLESSVPVLFVRSASFTAPANSRNTLGKSEPNLQTQFTIYGAIDPLAKEQG